MEGKSVKVSKGVAVRVPTQSDTTFGATTVTNIESGDLGIGSIGQQYVNSFPFTALAADRGIVYWIDTSAEVAEVVITMPPPVDGLLISFKDVGFNLSVARVRLARDSGGNTIEGLASDYLLEADGGAWSWQANGTGWSLIA